MLLLCVNLPQTTSYWILPPPKASSFQTKKHVQKKWWTKTSRIPTMTRWTLPLGLSQCRSGEWHVPRQNLPRLGGGGQPRPPRSLIVNRDFSLLRFGDPDLNPWKLTWHWEITMFNRKYIFKQLVLHCHVSFRGSKPSFDTTGKDNPKFFSLYKRDTLVLEIEF